MYFYKHDVFDYYTPFTLLTKRQKVGLFLLLFIREHHDAGVTSSYLSLCVVECNAKGEKIGRSEQ